MIYKQQPAKCDIENANIAFSFGRAIEYNGH